MHSSNKVPSTHELKGLVSATTEMQDNYIYSLQIYTFDQLAINKLEDRVVHLTPSAFKTQSIEVNPIQHRSLQDYKMQVELNKVKFDQQEFQLEQQKQEFYEKLQTKKLEFQCVKVVFISIGLLLTACLMYAYFLQAPQFAVSVGESIQMVTVDPKLQGIRGTIIVALAFGVGLATIRFCC